MELFLRAASAQINELGYRGTSIDKIAARINLTKGAFYHHIDTKDELVAACFKRTFDALHGTILAAEASSASGLQTLSTFVSALVNHQIRGEAPLLRTSAISTALDLTKVTILNEITKVTTRVASIICDGIADGSIRKIDANVGAQMVMAIINNADELPQYLSGISPTLALELYVHPIFRGIFQRAA
jgi:AcrR family transcriptional regulator